MGGGFYLGTHYAAAARGYNLIILLKHLLSSSTEIIYGV